MAGEHDDKTKDDASKKDAHRDDSKKDTAKDDASKKDGEEVEKKEGEDDKSKDDASRKDADAGTSLDKMLAHITDSVKSIADTVSGLGKRMDAMDDSRKDSRKDGAKKDGEEGDADRTVADKAKKDSDEEKEREDARKDAARKDKERDDKAKADSADIRKQIDEVRSAIPKDMNDVDYLALLDAQSRADEVFIDFGQRSPRPQQGETVSLYERRCVKMLKEHSPTWKAADVSKAFADDASFGIVRDQVYREARQAAQNPVNVPSGQMRMVERKRDGHTVRDFYGEPRTWMDPLAGAVQLRGTGTFQTQSLGKQ